MAGIDVAAFAAVAANADDPAARAPLLDVRALRVDLGTGSDVVADISFAVAAGEIVGLVGESGSGKTTVAAALLGHTRAGARIAGGAIRIDGIDILALPEGELGAVRGRLIGHVAQDPAMALNPLHRIGAQLDETLRVHEPALAADLREQRTLAVFGEVGLPTEREFLRRFPHQLSGGQQQRVQLALAFALRPRLIVLDEPTTALDVSTQARVLATIRALCRSHGVAAVYVSHDLAVVRALADRVLVLYAGRLVEQATLPQLFAQPAHPYTQGLLAAILDVAETRALQPIPGQAPAPGTRPAGCAFAARCPLRSALCEQTAPPSIDLGGGHRAACWHLDSGPAFAPAEAPVPLQAAASTEPLLAVDALSAYYGARKVVSDFSLQIAAGECVALVGESGSGKTTIARALAGLGDNASGTLAYAGAALPLRSRERSTLARRQIQYIFQNPYRALNPRQRVGDILAIALRHFFDLNRRDAQLRAAAALERVALQPELLRSYPRELSGGERQRVAIARALVCEPRLLICDEITSALDVSVQATILALLRELQGDGLALLFVTHNLGVVRAIADRVAVLHRGAIVETGSVASVLDSPAADYTRALIGDSPSLRQPLASGFA